MKKIFTLITVALLGMGSVHAQTEGVVELSWDTMVKNEAGDNTADQNEIKFEGNGFVREDVPRPRLSARNAVKY